MSGVSEMYEEFWNAFYESYHWPSELIGSPDKFVHRAEGKPKNYLDFDRDFGNGFRPTAAVSKQKNHLQAQLSTDKRGRNIVAKLKKNQPVFGNAIEPYTRYFVSKSDAKIELIWQGTDVENRQLWPVHHLWLRNSLELLATIYAPIIAGSNQ